MEVDFAADRVIEFTCNICGRRTSQPAGEFHRESPNCKGCHSNPRFRGIIHALSLGLLQASVPLRKFPTDRRIRGVGMSEWDRYARVLKKKFSFTNTFFHTEPYLDITGDDWQRYQDQDFLICTEVFEHVLQPLDVAFGNMRKMLKTGGVLVFSVPFTSAPTTTEHFPGMVDFGLCEIDGQWLVVSKQADGGFEVHHETVVFHGGPGTVLEMRVFGQDELVKQLETAGFEVEVLSQAVPDIGYYWPKVMDRPEIGYPGLHYILLCRAV